MIHIDHKNLEYMKTLKILISRQARFFSNFPLLYCPGSKNIKANSLSHCHPVPPQEHCEEFLLIWSQFMGTINCEVDSETDMAPEQPAPFTVLQERNIPNHSTGFCSPAYPQPFKEPSSFLTVLHGKNCDCRSASLRVITCKPVDRLRERTK